MKRFIRVLLICTFLLTSFGIFPGLAAPGDQPPIFLPFVVRVATSYTISGKIMDVDQVPVSNVTITDKHGVSAMSDLDGHYALNVQPGPNTLTVHRSGYEFTPEQIEINVSTNIRELNLVAQTGCGDVMVNGTIDRGMGGWDFPDTEPDAIATAGTDNTVFNSASYSGRTGIPPTATFNVYSASKGVSQVYHIPSNADSVYLGLWVYQLSTSAVGEPDRQYIQILDKEDNVLSTLFWANANTAAWTYVEYPLNSFIGDSIVVEVGTLNDGLGGVAAMYFDDVVLYICESEEEDEDCTNEITNGGFEATGGWNYIGPQVVPPAYSTTYAHAGSYSMLTGIPVGGTNQIAFTEIFQEVSLPSGADKAELSFWIYTTSSVTTTELNALGPLDFDSIDTVMIPQTDQQYAYILDEDGDVERVLLKMYASNANAWLHYSFNVSAYLGDTIQILFGTYNDGIGGSSAIYIDDVILETCDT